MKQNSILIIKPYKYYGTWVFDDADTGLVREAFVSGADKIIDALTAHIPNADKGFRLLFSATEFPGCKQITWLRSEFGGNWYHSEELGIDGWLCAALFLYFDTAPQAIYVQCLELE